MNMNEPCCNAAGIMARTCKELLAEKDADIQFRDDRIVDLQAIIDRQREEIQVALDTLALAFRFHQAQLQQRDMEIARLLVGDDYRAAVIAEQQDRLRQAGALDGVEAFCHERDQEAA